MTTLTAGGTRWVSRWASLADTYSDSGPASGLFDMPTQVDLSAGGMETLLGSVVFLAFVFASTFHLSYLGFFKLVKGSSTRLCLTEVLTTQKQAKAADQDEFCLGFLRRRKSRHHRQQYTSKRILTCPVWRRVRKFRSKSGICRN